MTRPTLPLLEDGNKARVSETFSKIETTFGHIASSDTYALVGLSIACCADMERVIGCVLAILIVQPRSHNMSPAEEDLYDRTIVSTTGKDTRVALGLTMTLVRMSFPHREEDFNKLQTKILKAIEKRRNPLAHWLLETETRNGIIKFRQLKTLGKAEIRECVFTKSQLEQLPFEFIGYSKQLIAFVKSLGLVWPHSREVADSLKVQ